MSNDARRCKEERGSARHKCLARLAEIERIATDLRASLYDPDADPVDEYLIVNKAKAVHEAFQIYHATGFALANAEHRTRFA